MMATPSTTLTMAEQLVFDELSAAIEPLATTTAHSQARRGRCTGAGGLTEPCPLSSLVSCRSAAEVADPPALGLR